MATLTQKVKDLRASAKRAEALADFWDRQIVTVGDEKATRFYKHLGLNHLETKSYDWEGMTLSREPTDVEKLCLKSVASAQESGKESVKVVLLKVREELIEQGIKEISDIKPADYHTLTLTVSTELRSDLRDELKSIFNRGKKLVAQELNAQKSKGLKEDTSDESDEETDELDDYTDLTNSRITNDVQSRIAAAAARYRLLGLLDKALDAAIRKEVEEGSTTYIDRAARGTANKVLNLGREEEAKNQEDNIERIEYSAILDQNCCDPCASDDGQTASSEDDLTPVPNPSCFGGENCRCFHIFISS